MSDLSDIAPSGFGTGFSREIEAILQVSDRGMLYAQEVRENLAKAGMIIYEKVDMPDVDPPILADEYDEYDEEITTDDTEEPT